jgi:hypothetical protein
MATNTYVALDETTVGTAVPSITFTSIPQGYTDLVLVCTFNGSSFSWSTRVGNGSADSGANYSITRLYGTGSAAASNRYTGETYFTGNITGAADTNCIIQFNNYSNTTTYKTALNRFNDAGAIVFAIAGLWSNTAAINTVQIVATSGSLPVGSTFSLYGIKAQVTPGTAKATGGTITYDQSGNLPYIYFIWNIYSFGSIVL